VFGNKALSIILLPKKRKQEDREKYVLMISLFVAFSSPSVIKFFGYRLIAKDVQKV
jgi:hypothetical protein